MNLKVNFRLADRHLNCSYPRCQISVFFKNVSVIFIKKIARELDFKEVVPCANILFYESIVRDTKVFRKVDYKVGFNSFYMAILVNFFYKRSTL